LLHFVRNDKSDNGEERKRRRNRNDGTEMDCRATVIDPDLYQSKQLFLVQFHHRSLPRQKSRFHESFGVNQLHRCAVSLQLRHKCGLLLRCSG